MVNMNDCLQVAIDNGEIDPRRGKDSQAAYNQLVDRYKTSMPLHVAEAAAAADLKVAVRRMTNSRAHAVIEQLKTAQRNNAIYGAPDATPNLLIRNLERTRFERDGIMKQIHGDIAEFLRENARDLKGDPRNKVLLGDVVRELHGEKTGNAHAAQMAQAIQRAQTRLRTLFNAHGGDIGELADFGMPHVHDVSKLRKAGFDTWRDDVFDKIDWNRITDNTTGKPFALGGRPNRAAADRFLKDVYDGITTRGWNRREASFSPGGKALYNQRADARVLHFKNADMWMQYNEHFGGTNPFDSIVSHLDGMARDIALMRNFGPNPQAGLDHALQVLEKSANLALDDKMAAKLAAKSKLAKAMLGQMDGSGNVPANHAWAAFFAGTRQMLTAAQLGSATLSAVTDLATVRMAAKAVGMNPNNTISRATKLIASKASRQEAAAMGYVADTLADAGSASARYLGDVWSPEITERFSNFVMKASGLSHWTDMNRIAFQMEFGAHLAQQVGKKFDDMDPLIRKALEMGGITADDWAKIADPAALFIAPNGARFIATKHWLETTSLPRAEAEGLAIRLQSVFEEQMEFAIPSVSLEGRAKFIGDSAPGTIGGELLRSSAMYKNYAISLTLNQYRRIMALETKTARAVYAAQLVGGMTIMGAFAVQLKELSKGRDPRSMDDVGFWGAAMAQGGGIGIFGDFFKSETSRSGGGLAETLAGPVVGLAGDATRLVASNATRAFEGKDTFIGRDITNLARRYTPGTSLWYARTPLDRLTWDQMQRFLDPDAEKQFRRAEKRQQREYGNASWWAKGQALPRRAPDLSNALGAN